MDRYLYPRVLIEVEAFAVIVAEYEKSVLERGRTAKALALAFCKSITRRGTEMTQGERNIAEALDDMLNAYEDLDAAWYALLWWMHKDGNVDLRLPYDQL